MYDTIESSSKPIEMQKKPSLMSLMKSLSLLEHTTWAEKIGTNLAQFSKHQENAH